MRGGSNNAAVIPYSAFKSTLFIFTNTNESLGPTSKPTMPINEDALNETQVKTIKNWINNGAPNNRNEVKFQQSAKEDKYYVLNSLCDEVSVINANTNLIERYVSIQKRNKLGASEIIRISANGEKWYVLVASGELIEFDASTDLQQRNLQLPTGLWRSFTISKLNNVAAVASWSGNSDFNGGQIYVIDLNSMTILKRINHAQDSIFFPFALQFNDTGNELYAGCYTGNFIYQIKLKTTDYEVNKIVIDGVKSVNFTSNTARLASFALIPTSNFLAVISEISNELILVNTKTNNIEKTIQIGNFPQEMLVSIKTGHIVISCSEDKIEGKSNKGSVYILDMGNFEVVKILSPGYQPKALALDPKRNKVIVVNRNADLEGANRPHHYTDCQGNNGYATIIDLSSLNLVYRLRIEVSVNPYSAATRILDM